MPCSTWCSLSMVRAALRPMAKETSEDASTLSGLSSANLELTTVKPELESSYFRPDLGSSSTLEDIVVRVKCWTQSAAYGTPGEVPGPDMPCVILIRGCSDMQEEEPARWIVCCLSFLPNLPRDACTKGFFTSWMKLNWKSCPVS